MNDASRLAVGQAQYSALLYPQGTFVDDVVVHRLGEDEYLLVINAGTREKDFNWVRDNTRQFNCKVEDLSDDFTQIAIQGPKAVNLLQKLTDADLSAVKFYWVTRGTVCGLKNTLIARTGYTGEDGFEIYVPSTTKPARECGTRFLRPAKNSASFPAAWVRATRCVWRPSCRSTVTRFLTQSMSGKPVWIASAKWRSPNSSAEPLWKKPRPQGLKRTLVGLEMIDRGIARDGYRVLDNAGGEIGYVTSGSPAPFLKKNIALAYVPPSSRLWAPN